MSPCVFRSWNTGLGNGQWRTWIAQAMRLPSLRDRNIAINHAIRPYGFHQQGQAITHANGVTTIRSVGTYKPFASMPGGRARQVLSYSGTRVVVTFLGMGPNAPEKAKPTFSQMVSQTQRLTMPTGGAIPLGRNYC